MNNLALLVRKDMISTWAMLRFYLLLFVLIGLGLSLGNATAGLSYIPIMLVYFLTYGLASYEERYQSKTLAFSLPVTLKEFVTARYLFCMGSCALFLFACYLCNLIPRLLWGEDSAAPTLLLLYFSMTILYISVVFPLIFRFGLTKGRFMAMAIYLLAFFGGSAFSVWATSQQELVVVFSRLQNPLILLTLFSLVVSALSCRLSIGLIQRYRLV